MVDNNYYYLLIRTGDGDDIILFFFTGYRGIFMILYDFFFIIYIIVHQIPRTRYRILNIGYRFSVFGHAITNLKLYIILSTRVYTGIHLGCVRIKCLMWLGKIFDSSCNNNEQRILIFVCTAYFVNLFLFAGCICGRNKIIFDDLL